MAMLELTPDEARLVRLALIVRVETYVPYGEKPKAAEHKQHADTLRKVIDRLPIG